MLIDNARVPEVSDLFEAQKRVSGVVKKTPLLENPLLNEITGKRIFVKAECLQTTGAFKFRGAWSALTFLTESQRKNGVLAYSSGNHAQAVAYAAALLKTKATIIMPNDAPKLKLDNTRAYAAEVVLYDRPGGEDREAIGRRIAAEQGSILIKPYDNTQVIAGQGTCGLEIADQLQERNIENPEVLACCGGGGLTAGIALAFEDKLPGTSVRPVEPEHYDDVCRSLQDHRRLSVDTQEHSICDAIVTPSPGEYTFPILDRACAPGIAVTDTEALKAMAVAANYFKLVAEPGGAVALAAALFHHDKLQSDTIVSVISGGNADPALFAKALSLDPF